MSRDNEQQFVEDFIAALNVSVVDEYDDQDGAFKMIDDEDCTQFIESIAAVRDFKQCDLLVNNAGFVINLKDGREFQVTVVESI